MAMNMPAERSRLRNLGRFFPGFCMCLEGREKTFPDFCNAPTIASKAAIQKKKNPKTQPNKKSKRRPKFNLLILNRFTLFVGTN